MDQSSLQAHLGIYMLVSVVVLINLLIAMMSDTYQRIQAQSDIEWKYGLSKLVRNMHRTNTAPSPLNLLTTWMTYLFKHCKKRAAKKQRPSLVRLMGLQRTDALSPRSKMATKWLSKVKKTQVGHKESIALSVVQLSPLAVNYRSVTLSESITLSIGKRSDESIEIFMVKRSKNMLKNRKILSNTTPYRPFWKVRWPVFPLETKLYLLLFLESIIFTIDILKMDLFEHILSN